MYDDWVIPHHWHPVTIDQLWRVIAAYIYHPDFYPCSFRCRQANGFTLIHFKCSYSQHENHPSFFGAFAPRDNPKIAIAVMCENAGFGAATAAPIASLMIEKCLRDSIAGKERQDLAEEMSKKNLIPALMKEAMNRMDSVKHVREKQKEQLLQEKLNKESGDESEIEAPVEQENKPAEEPKNKKPAPVKTRVTAAAILNDEEQRIKKAITRI